MSRSHRLDSTYKSMMIIALVLVAVLLAGNLIMPVLFSGIVTILISPIASFFESKKISRGFSALLTVLLISGIFFYIIFALIIQSQEIVQELPALIIEKGDFINLQEIDWRSSAVVNYVEEHLATLEELIEQGKAFGVAALKQSLTGIRDTLTFLILCPIYIFFMLMSRAQLHRAILAFQIGENGSVEKEKEANKLVNDLKHSLTQYLKGLITIMTISGTFTFLGLYFIGLDYALFLGVLTALLTPIPYIGVTISALIPILLALLTKDSLWYVAGVLIVFAIVQFSENYILTPRIMGNNVNVNPLMIVIGLIVFGSLTGAIGMVLTVPLLAMTKVIVDFYPHLKPWKKLLEDKISEN
jgi:predicted PurR-regulated permease PerM